MKEQQSWLSVKEPVWLLKNGSFIKALIESINKENKDIFICQLEDGNYAQAKKQQLFQRNQNNQEFNPDRWDLMDTDLLNEPEVLRTLKLRLLNSRIYTFVENSVISVNPYTPIKTLCMDQLKEFYISCLVEQGQDVRQFQPHIYSIGASMLKELKRTGIDQAVIISGESGSGKTEANKELLRFLQYYFRNRREGIDDRIDGVLNLSNPIL